MDIIYDSELGDAALPMTFGFGELIVLGLYDF